MIAFIEGITWATLLGFFDFFRFLRTPQKPPRGIFSSLPTDSSRKTDPLGFLRSCFWPSGGRFVAKHDFCVFSKENLCCSDIHEPYATCILCMHKSHMSACHDDMSSMDTGSSWSCAGGTEGGAGGGVPCWLVPSYSVNSVTIIIIRPSKKKQPPGWLCYI